MEEMVTFPTTSVSTARAGNNESGVTTTLIWVAESGIGTQTHCTLVETANPTTGSFSNGPGVGDAEILAVAERVRGDGDADADADPDGDAENDIEAV